MTERPVFADRYEISARIGRGGMADVFLAHDRLLDRKVAVKVLFPEFATDALFVQRFRREAQAAANLTHPNVVGVYDWGEQSGTYFMVMEYVKGRTLADILRDEHTISSERAATIAGDVAAALSVAHRSGLVHRDVKPGNILVSDRGDVKVADFGISRSISGESDLTQTGSVMGTATYFSPEQAQGLQPDTRSDLYSLGVVLYEMVTGRPPFTGDNPVAIAYKQVHEMPAAPTKVNPNIPTAFEQIIRKLLQKDPNKRMQRAEDLQADLKRFLAGDVPDPMAQARSMPYEPTVAQPRMGATAQGAAATQVLPPTQTRVTQAYRDQMGPGAGANGGYNAPPPRSSSPVDLPPERRAAIGAWIGGLIGVLALVGLGFGLWKVLNTTNTGSAATIEVPDVRGMPVVDATKLLVEAGFQVPPDRVTEQPSTEVNPGTVIETDPPAGKKVARGSIIALRISVGQGKVDLIDFTGRTYEEAAAALADAGLVPVREGEVSDTAVAGVVLRQEPATGTVYKGSAVTLIVSIGRGNAAVPDVTNQLEADALAAVNEFFVAAIVVETSETVIEGTVIRTNPPAGTELEKGANVEVVVSGGAAPIDVPDVVGKTLGEAQDILRNAGFVPRVTDVEVSDPAQVGVVISTTPAAGEKLTKGKDVVINYGARLTTTTPPPTVPVTTAAPTTAAPPPPPDTAAPTTPAPTPAPPAPPATTP
jgi:eukaryotic-like serine/threonine-protein kinase